MILKASVTDIVRLIMLSYFRGKPDRQVPELACQVARCCCTKKKSQDVSSLDLSMGLRICWHNWAWQKCKVTNQIQFYNESECVYSSNFFHMRCSHVFSSCVAASCLGSDLISSQLQGQACQRPWATAAPCRAAQVWRLVGSLQTEAQSRKDSVVHHSFDVIWLSPINSSLPLRDNSEVHVTLI